MTSQVLYTRSLKNMRDFYTRIGLFDENKTIPPGEIFGTPFTAGTVLHDWSGSATVTILETETPPDARAFILARIPCVREGFEVLGPGVAARPIDPSSRSADAALELRDPDGNHVRVSGPWELPRLSDLDLVVFDFDGVMTENGVWLDRDGTEFVRCDRSDGLGVARLRDLVPMLVLSTETNEVVTARAAKLRIPVAQGIRDKKAWLSDHLHSKGWKPERVLFVGNDINDVPCMASIGWPCAVADAYPAAKEAARIQLHRCGGRGAVRELCDLVLSRP